MSRIKLKQSFIENSINNLEINQDPDRSVSTIFAFQTRELRDKFMNNFFSLLKQVVGLM